jgi:hypothetical protein
VELSFLESAFPCHLSVKVFKIVATPIIFLLQVSECIRHLLSASRTIISRKCIPMPSVGKSFQNCRHANNFFCFRSVNASAIYYQQVEPSILESAFPCYLSVKVFKIVTTPMIFFALGQ